MLEYSYDEAHALLSKNYEVVSTYRTRQYPPLHPAHNITTSPPTSSDISHRFVLQSAQTRLKAINADINFVKDQITTQEVTIARVHNHRIKLKQLNQKADKTKS